MSENGKETSDRKRDHIEICLNEDVGFKTKTTGFENYDFLHYAPTELAPKDINLKTSFFGKGINYPFLISCMTGGTTDAESINMELARAANHLNIPIGAGSQRQALEDDLYLNSFKIIRKYAGNAPVMGNIGAAQIARAKDPTDLVESCVDMLEADAMVIHINPAQELFQRNGEPGFKGFGRNLRRICNKVKTPIIVKEVGAGISESAAEMLLDSGVGGIDVAGAGGTSWTAVEMLRNQNLEKEDEFFWNWGIPTARCIRKIHKLRKKRDFLLIGSGGINDGIEIAKALALGADITASAGAVLKAVHRGGMDSVVELVVKNFEIVKNIMCLTGSKGVKALRQKKIININK